MIGGNQFLSPIEVITLANVREGDYVADLGAGSGGFFVIPLARKVGITGKVYAVDILPEALMTIQSAANAENLKNVETIRSNLEVRGATPIPKESLDTAFLINVLFQNTDHQTIIEEAISFTKKKGVIVVIDWKESGAFGPPKDRLITLKDIEPYFKGFKKIKEGDVGKFHFFSIYKKI